MFAEAEKKQRNIQTEVRNKENTDKDTENSITVSISLPLAAGFADREKRKLNLHYKGNLVFLQILNIQDLQVYTNASRKFGSYFFVTSLFTFSVAPLGVLRVYVVAHLVKVLRYEPESRGFDSQTFYWPNPSSRNMALGSTQPLTDTSTRNTAWGGKGGRCLRVTNLPLSYADCLEIWEFQPPGTIGSSPGMYGNSFTELGVLVREHNGQ